MGQNTSPVKVPVAAPIDEVDVRQTPSPGLELDFEDDDAFSFAKALPADRSTTAQGLTASPFSKYSASDFLRDDLDRQDLSQKSSPREPDTLPDAIQADTGATGSAVDDATVVVAEPRLEATLMDDKVLNVPVHLPLILSRVGCCLPRCLPSRTRLVRPR